MDKRKFLKVSGIVGAGVIMSPMMSCSNPAEKKEADPAEKTKPPSVITEFKQSTLGYDYRALEPHIDKETMKIHFSKHHAGYVRKLNAALAKSDVKPTSLESLLGTVTADQTAIRNNAGGHFNHSLYWNCISPNETKAPAGKLAEAINSAFGSEEKFNEAFFNAAKTRFGSGWAWLNVSTDGKLFISSTANQDNPLMTEIVKETGTPILGIDVWEHAYYLKHQNMRGDYIKAFMDIINWDVVAANFATL